MPKLFMLLIGCSPPGRNVEQHDIFFGIGETIKDLIPDLIKFWPETQGKLHIDAWREVTYVNGHIITVISNDTPEVVNSARLFFINLGGYKQNEFEEFHYKMIIAAADKEEAVRQSKKTAFFIHTGYKSAPSHIDDKYGIDVDDIFQVEDILGAETKKQYWMLITPVETLHAEDEIHLGYFKLSSFR
ncbi:MAG: DUF1543 domain-containing protein [Bacteroidota bacterium]